MLERSAHLVFAHLTTERAPLYRAVLGAFVRAKQRFALHLRPDDVERALAADARDSDLSGVGSALAQLVEWGNLEAHPDTADVTSVEEFYRPRYLYQLTVAGEAAERALQLFDDAMRARGELQSVALTDIRQLLEELLETASGDPIDGGKAHRTLLALRGRFEELTARAQAFMASLQRTIDLHGLTVDALVTYKESLIDYLERFIGDLLLATAEIAEILYKLDERNVGRLVAAVAAREMTDALAPTAAERAAAIEIWEGRWQGLRGWFIPHGGEPSQAEVLRHRARAAIPALLSAVASFNDRRVARSDRAADLRALALWFAESETDEEAHRLWRAAFGLSSARHLSIDDETLAAREENAVPAQTSWLEAPPIGISPRLRESGRFTRPGPASRVIDRSAEKAILSRLLEEETAQIETARRRLATGRPTRLSEIGALGRAEFDLLLDLLGEAIAGRARPGDVVETASGDGSLAIRLAPPPDGPDAPPARIETATGALYAPDFVVTITDSLGASEGGPAS